MTDYVEPLYPYEKEREYQESYIRYMYGFYGYGMWIVCDRESGKLIGRAGVEHREELGDELEFGYAIGVDYQKKAMPRRSVRRFSLMRGTNWGIKRVNCLIEAWKSGVRASGRKIRLCVSGGDAGGRKNDDALCQRAGTGMISA